MLRQWMRAADELLRIPLPIPVEGFVESAGRLLGISRESVLQTVELIRNTWDAQTLEGLLRGKVTITEEVLNSYLAYQLKGTAGADSLQVFFPDGHVEIRSATKEWGKVVLTGNLRDLRHNPDESIMIFEVMDKKLPDKKLISWLASWVSLGFLARIFGPLAFGDGIQVQVEGNRVTAEFRDRLNKAIPHSAQIFGKPMLDAIIIQQAAVRNRAIDLSCGLEVDEGVRSILEMLLARRRVGI